MLFVTLRTKHVNQLLLGKLNPALFYLFPTRKKFTKRVKLHFFSNAVETNSNYIGVGIISAEQFQHDFLILF
jgi:hypothetical protein